MQCLLMLSIIAKTEPRVGARHRQWTRPKVSPHLSSPASIMSHHGRIFHLSHSKPSEDFSVAFLRVDTLSSSPCRCVISAGSVITEPVIMTVMYSLFLFVLNTFQ